VSLIVECYGAYRDLVRLERLVRLSGRIGPGNGGCKSLSSLCGSVVCFGFGLSNVWKGGRKQGSSWWMFCWMSANGVLLLPPTSTFAQFLVQVLTQG
jgi:hypothetical protein